MTGVIHSLTLAVFAAAWLASAQEAGAQAINPAGFVSRVDQFGNARYWYTDRRYVGVFQSPAQRIAAQGYQDYGRRPERRVLNFQGGVPQDVADIGRFRRALLPLSTGLGTTPYGYRGLSFGSGFIGSTPGLISRPGDIDQVLSRRYDLLEQTALYNPAEEISEQQRLAAGLPESRRSIPFRRLVNSIPSSASALQTGATNPTGIEAPGPSFDKNIFQESAGDGTGPGLPLPLYGTEGAGETSAYATVSLGRRLLEISESQYEPALERGWAEFGDRRYQRALRQFERARILRSEAAEPVLGQLFSLLANGSIKSAAALLRVESDRGESLFATAVDLGSRFSEPREANSLRLSLGSLVQRERDVAEVAALNVLLLWHLGDRTAAIQDARRLAQEHPTSAYAGWPEIMERVNP
ncbi:MAG: hypothetical protein J5J06_19085 [Phycisphaerae bacterium]|nr:hypothetical protein [Phycisphaerae bacterium]